MNVHLYIRKFLKVISYVSSVKSGQNRKWIVIPFLLLWHETHQTEHRSDSLPTLSWNLRFLPECGISNRSRNSCSVTPRGMPRSSSTSTQAMGCSCYFCLRNVSSEKSPQGLNGDRRYKWQKLEIATPWQGLNHPSFYFSCYIEKHYWVSGFQLSYDFFLCLYRQIIFSSPEPGKQFPEILL